MTRGKIARGALTQRWVSVLDVDPTVFEDGQEVYVIHEGSVMQQYEFSETACSVDINAYGKHLVVMVVDLQNLDQQNLDQPTTGDSE